jgi:hypothetical protein
VTYISSVVDSQYDVERRDASVSLLALKNSLPSTGAAENRLDAELAAEDARHIAAHWDERARQQNKVISGRMEKRDVFDNTSLAMTIEDSPLWRVRVRVSLPWSWHFIKVLY